MSVEERPLKSHIATNARIWDVDDILSGLVVKLERWNSTDSSGGSIELRADDRGLDNLRSILARVPDFAIVCLSVTVEN